MSFNYKKWLHEKRVVNIGKGFYYPKHIVNKVIKEENKRKDDYDARLGASMRGY